MRVSQCVHSGQGKEKILFQVLALVRKIGHILQIWLILKRPIELSAVLRIRDVYPGS
jgi:hypothetical protein